MIKTNTQTIIKLLLLLLVVLLPSCKTVTHNSVVGNYVYNKDIVDIQLFLNHNNEFEFVHRLPLYYRVSKGLWILEGENIILNSYNTYKLDYIEVEEKVLDKSGYLMVVDSMGREIPDVNIIFNESTEKIKTDVNGKVFCPNIHDIKCITVEYLGLSNGYYRVIDPQANCFIIRIYPDDLEKVFFSHQKCRPSKNSLQLNEHKLRKL